MDIGEKIKRMRIEKQLTQEELANRCELSKGFISQLENNLTSPSIATLIDILEILGTNLREFFNEIDNERICFTKDDMFETEDEDLKYTLKWLIPNSQKNEMEPILLELEPNGSSNEIVPHEGEEFAYVIAGKIEIRFDEGSSILSKGDTFYIKGDKGHTLVNPYSQKAKVLWVCTPPIF